MVKIVYLPVMNVTVYYMIIVILTGGTARMEKEESMTNDDAIETIKSNWPPENYSILREALTLAIHALSEEQHSKSCSYYAENDKKPCCTHSCDGCMWYV